MYAEAGKNVTIDLPSYKLPRREIIASAPFVSRRIMLKLSAVPPLVLFSSAKNASCPARIDQRRIEQLQIAIAVRRVIPGSKNNLNAGPHFRRSTRKNTGYK